LRADVEQVKPDREIVRWVLPERLNRLNVVVDRPESYLCKMDESPLYS
jgi:hypothetical protein